MNAQEIINNIAVMVEQADSTGAHTPDEWYDYELIRWWNEAQEDASEDLARTGQNWVIWQQIVSVVAGTQAYDADPNIDAVCGVLTSADEEVAWMEGTVPSDGNFLDHARFGYNPDTMVVENQVERWSWRGSQLRVDPSPSASATRTILYYPLFPRLHVGTAEAGGAATITLDADSTKGLPEPIDDYYNNLDIEIISGTSAGDRRTASDYVGSTRVLTVSSDWTSTPDATSVYAFVTPLPRQFWRAVIAKAAELALASKGMEKSATYWGRRYESLWTKALSKKRQQYQMMPLDLTSTDLEDS